MLTYNTLDASTGVKRKSKPRRKSRHDLARVARDTVLELFEVKPPVRCKNDRRLWDCAVLRNEAWEPLTSTADYNLTPFAKMGVATKRILQSNFDGAEEIGFTVGTVGPRFCFMLQAESSEALERVVDKWFPGAYLEINELGFRAWPVFERESISPLDLNDLLDRADAALWAKERVRAVGRCTLFRRNGTIERRGEFLSAPMLQDGVASLKNLTQHLFTLNQLRPIVEAAPTAQNPSFLELVCVPNPGFLRGEPQLCEKSSRFSHRRSALTHLIEPMLTHAAFDRPDFPNLWKWYGKITAAEVAVQVFGAESTSFARQDDALWQLTYGYDQALGLFRTMVDAGLCGAMPGRTKYKAIRDLSESLGLVKCFDPRCRATSRNKIGVSKKWVVGERHPWHAKWTAYLPTLKIELLDQQTSDASVNGRPH